MNTGELYQHIKDSLAHFGLSFFDMPKMEVEFREKEVIFSYEGRSITIKDRT